MTITKARACKGVNQATPTRCRGDGTISVRSLKCSARSSLDLYNDKGREGDYVMTDTGAEMTGLGAVMSSYIYFSTYAEKKNKPAGKK